MLLYTNGVSFLYEAVAHQEVQNGEMVFLEIEDYAYMHPLMFLYRKNSTRRPIYDALYRQIVENKY